MEIDGNIWIPGHAVKILKTNLGLPNGIFVCGDSKEIMERHGQFLAECIVDEMKKNGSLLDYHLLTRHHIHPSRRVFNRGKRGITIRFGKA